MSIFPTNVIELLATRLKIGIPDHTVVRRPLRGIDPALSIGIFVHNWVPDQRTVQMGDQREPVVADYQFRIQNMVKHSNEVEGEALFSALAKSIRVILYRDAVLHASLTGLNETIMGTVEKVKQYGVSRTQFVNQEVARGQWFYVASTEFWVQTETRKL